MVPPVFIILGILGALYAGANGILIVKPHNHAVSTGHEITLHCQTNETAPLRWNGRIHGSPKEAKMIIVYSGYRTSQYAAGFAKRSSNVDGEYSLLITATKKAAMNYECLEPGSLSASSAVVTVVEHGPICNTLWGEEIVDTTCFIDFQGDWAPTMEWRRCDGTVVSANVSQSIDRVTSNIARKRNDCNNSECYKVTVCFKEDGRPLGVDADNIPLYSRSSYVNESLYVHCLTEKRRDKTSIILRCVGLSFAIVVPVIVVIVIVVVVYCCCCRKNNNNKSPKRDSWKWKRLFQTTASLKRKDAEL